MAKGKKQDFTQIAYRVVQEATGNITQPPPPQAQVDPNKNPHAVALGRLGGLKGGKARAESLSQRQRSLIAKKAAQARWNSVSR